MPGNRSVTLVTRGNNASGGKPEDPGAIKTFGFANGMLSNLASIAPGNGLGFGPRHLDFHPTKPWAFVSIERQNKLYVYKLDDATGLARDPMFIKDTLSNPASSAPQGAGPVHVHPDGRFVYVTNRTFPASGSGAREISTGGENTVAVFAIDQTTGEPNRIQTIDGGGIQLRTFGVDPSGRMLAVASIMALEDGTLPAGITVIHVGGDGKLEFARKYEICLLYTLQREWFLLYLESAAGRSAKAMSPPSPICSPADFQIAITSSGSTRWTS